MATRELPTGTVTFLFSDIEGSTRLLQELGDAYADLLQEHRSIFREAIAEHDGTEVGTDGDSFFVVFPTPLGAVQAVVRIQRLLADHPFPSLVRVRMGLHTGQGRVSGDDYVGIDVHRAARIAAAGHGGQILISDATRALVEHELTADLTVRDLGSHRLKDLSQPERLYQLLVQGLASDFPPPRTLDARPNNLPVQLTRFIGREEQISELTGRLLDGVRLLTLTGPGGTGKTRLALEVATQTLTAFDDGVWFVDLSPILESGLVVSTIAEVLGVKQTPGRPLLEALEGTLKDRAMLVVLDNFEQVVDAGAAVERLLQAAPRLKVMVTSRAVLHRRGEQEFPVPPLDLPDPGNLPGWVSLGEYEAIGLFVERAASVKPDFALTQDNAPAIAEIAVRLDGLPLAIELAASRVNILSPRAILERLGRGSELLASRVSDAPARQRTLRGAIEWSYDLLRPAERMLFEKLSVFQGGATLEAIESVSASDSGTDPLEGVASLVDHSLLRRIEGEGGEPRFVMLETIKGYAAERLAEAPHVHDATHRAHAGHFADFAQEQLEQLTGAGRNAALVAMAADIENLRTAWRYWAAQGDLEQLSKLADSLWLLFDARGWYHATVEIATDLLRVLSSTPSTPERALKEGMLRTSLARALMAIHGYTQEVEDEYAQALELFEGHERVPQFFPVLRGLTNFYLYRAEFEKAADFGERILRLAEAQDDPSMRVDGLLLTGAGRAMQGDLRVGLERLDEAIGCFESEGYRPRRLSLGNHPAVACFTTSALVLWMLGQPDNALQRADRAVALATELGHPVTLGYGLFHTAFLHLWRREPEIVRERALRLVDVADQHGLEIWRAVGRCLLGAAEVMIGSSEEGLGHMHEGLSMYHGLTTPPVFWPLLLSLQAGTYGLAGRPYDGLGLIEQASDIVGTGLLLPEFSLLKGDLLMAMPDEDTVATAEPLYRSALKMAEDLGARMTQLRAATRLSRLGRMRGDAREADGVLRAVYETFTEGFATADLVEAKELLEGAS